MGKPVVDRYDLADARWVLVYDEADVFICQAALRQTQHPSFRRYAEQQVT
jgi:hypothetical protein